MYTVNWEYGNCSGSLSFEDKEEAIEFAQLIDGTITIETEEIWYSLLKRKLNMM